MTEARGPLVRAGELARACGAVPLAARVEAALAATGVRQRGVGADRDELTATERQIAQLAAEGMTNRQIAGRLVVTPKTVEWHLTHAYAKLGVTSRRELAGALGRAAG
jgi:DNA-binding CsgD family transcriptional regulator